MSKWFVMIAIFMIATLPLFGQGASPGGMALDVSLETGIPVGDFSNSSSFGIGGVASGRYMIDDNLSLSLKAGYLRFSGKDVGGVTLPSSSIIPIMAGGRYFLTPTMQETAMRVYAAADLGLNIISNSTSTSKFGLAPILGATFKTGDNMDVDVHANYTFVFTDVSTTSWIGVGIGLEFGLQ